MLLRKILLPDVTLAWLTCVFYPDNGLVNDVWELTVEVEEVRPVEGRPVEVLDRHQVLDVHVLLQRLLAPAPVSDQRLQHRPHHVQLQAGPIQLQAGPIRLQAGPIRLQAGPIQLQAGPIWLQAGPIQLQAGPTWLQTPQPHTQLGTQLRAGPIHTARGTHTYLQRDTHSYTHTAQHTARHTVIITVISYYAYYNYIYHFF